jgi:glutamate synthase domain-containing protein 1
MCGVCGLFAKTPEARARLGADLAKMLDQLAERGPDSAGFSIYDGEAVAGRTRVSLLDPGGEHDFASLRDALGADLDGVELSADSGDQAVVRADADAPALLARISELAPELVPLAFGATVEAFKRTGSPQRLIEATDLRRRSGTHAVGHTRMATESRVSTIHSHPFCPAADLSLVHNGSLSNHNAVRRQLAGRRVHFDTDNDSEVAARYLAWRIGEGDSLEEALNRALSDLDGFFTFAVASLDSFAVVRDRFGCKPALLAETDDWVVVASEQSAIAALPGGADAEIYEAEPGRVYLWSLVGAAA